MLVSSCEHSARSQHSHLWHSAAIETHCDPSNVVIAMLDIKVHFVRDSWALLSFRCLGEVEERNSAHQQQADDYTLKTRHAE